MRRSTPRARRSNARDRIIRPPRHRPDSARALPADADRPASSTRRKANLRAVDSRALDQSERIELQVGLAALLYYEDRFGAAAELLEPVVDSSATLAPDAHERALDWWATALDRQAQAQPAGERATSISGSPNGWSSSCGAIPDRAPRTTGWPRPRAAPATSIAPGRRRPPGWIRASLAPDGGVALKADLDRLVTTAIIPDRAARLPPREQALTQARLGTSMNW